MVFPPPAAAAKRGRKPPAAQKTAAGGSFRPRFRCDDNRSILFGMCNADGKIPSSLLRQTQRVAAQGKIGTAGRLPQKLDLRQKESPHAGAERFGEGLLRTEARRSALWGKAAGRELLELLRAENAAEKTRIIERTPDPIDLKKIDAESYHGSEGLRRRAPGPKTSKAS